ncbi:hypothetical protein [Nocardioides sp. R-C-SC26]|uniref:hypothetical protein n=1 Tax=Nocardioides sp. R-C-SC26 TaxID=2870414 RepID=UPI001E541034|nr:hypothetical protein [Nocardioides sp. R-C-SC26]
MTTAAGQSPDLPPTHFEEGHFVRVQRLERQLNVMRKWSLKGTKQLHQAMIKDVRDAERRARQAEKRATAAEKKLKAAERRAKHAEAELAAIRSSTTWKAGRAITAVPGKLKRR